MIAIVGRVQGPAAIRGGGGGEGRGRYAHSGSWVVPLAFLRTTILLQYNKENLSRRVRLHDYRSAPQDPYSPTILNPTLVELFSRGYWSSGGGSEAEELVRIFRDVVHVLQLEMSSQQVQSFPSRRDLWEPKLPDPLLDPLPFNIIKQHRDAIHALLHRHVPRSHPRIPLLRALLELHQRDQRVHRFDPSCLGAPSPTPAHRCRLRRAKVLLEDRARGLLPPVRLPRRVLAFRPPPVRVGEELIKLLVEAVALDAEESGVVRAGVEGGGEGVRGAEGEVAVGAGEGEEVDGVADREGAEGAQDGRVGVVH